MRWVCVCGAAGRFYFHMQIIHMQEHIYLGKVWVSEFHLPLEGSDHEGPGCVGAVTHGIASSVGALTWWPSNA